MLSLSLSLLSLSLLSLSLLSLSLSLSLSLPLSYKHPQPVSNNTYMVINKRHFDRQLEHILHFVATANYFHAQSLCQNVYIHGPQVISCLNFMATKFIMPCRIQ